MSDFAPFKKHGYFVIALSMIAHSALIVWSHSSSVELYQTYFAMLAIMWLTFYFSLDLSNLTVTFASVRHVFYFFSLRGVTLAIFSLITHIPIREINSQGNSYLIVFQIAILLALIVIVCLKEFYLTKERLGKLLANRSQLIFVIAVKFSMGCYLMFNTYGSYYTANEQWYSLVHLVTSLLVIGVAGLALANSLRISEMLEDEKQTVALQKQLDLQVSHYKSYQKYTHSFREFRHDYKKVLSSINALLRNNEYEKAIRLLDDVGAHLAQAVEAHREYSNDVFLDAILQAFVNRCKDNGIQFEGVIYWNEDLKIDELKVVRIFNNILDNAFEAVMKLPQEERRITVQTRVRDYWVDVEIVNPFNGHLNQNLETTKTADKQSHGLGTKIVNETMEEIGGLVSLKHDNNIFRVQLHFPRNSNASRA